jgi:hypothetical protein
VVWPPPELLAFLICRRNEESRALVG